ncbi:MAG TPA: LysR family transcriptional regulator [Gammaproteobacteria bacterium]|mgnify:CR=1 FL=1|nr:LysR family transcriptional regulator [Gammaproteobacteria bacterium]HBF09708.1 LysR family transcriptional regulator [Gammaproteobacteria bacterium]HCK91556.1 LysR family transcriptional regulator [Gammaproteobacteria bacterium]|tara:strand:+ start:2033 stop:2968 length:936 start_codon:yes stop_codon:yes gene_type:complete
MQKTTLEQWRMFKAVVDAGGFNQASMVVHKSQSSVHHAVSKLEDALGIKLFEIAGRKAILTEAGKLMLRRGEYLLAEVGRIEAVADSLSTGIESELRIAVSGAFPQRIVFQALDSVSQLYPQLRIDIFDTVLSGTNELINEGKADIGLSPFLMSNGLNEEICLINFAAVAHPDHPLHQLNRTLTYEDLKLYRQIIVRDSATQNKASIGWHGAEQRWTVSHMRASIDLIQQGFGYAWLPLPSVQPLIDKGLLKRLPLREGASRTHSFYLNFLDKDQIGPAAREFIGAIRLLTLDMPVSPDVPAAPQAQSFEH